MRVDCVLAWIVCLFLYSPVMHAKQCFEKSPFIGNDTEAYFRSVSSEKPDRDQNTSESVKTYLNFMARLKGQWKGTSQKITCLGSAHSPEKRHQIYDSSFQVSISPENLVRLVFDKSKSDKKTTEKYLIANLLSDRAPVDYYFIVVGGDNTGLVLQTKYRVAYKKSANNMHEEILAFSILQDNKLKLSKTLYESGVLVSDEQFQLETDKKR